MTEVYGSTALVNLGRLFSLLIYTQSVELLPWSGVPWSQRIKIGRYRLVSQTFQFIIRHDAGMQRCVCLTCLDEHTVLRNAG
jgi:hypothetical protein